MTADQTDSEETYERTITVEGKGELLEDGGAVEMALIPEGDGVPRPSLVVRVVEADGHTTMFMLTRETFEVMASLYVDLMEPGVADADADEANAAAFLASDAGKLMCGRIAAEPPVFCASCGKYGAPRCESCAAEDPNAEGKPDAPA